MIWYSPELDILMHQFLEEFHWDSTGTIVDSKFHVMIQDHEHNNQKEK